MKTPCKNQDEKCHVFYDRVYNQAGYCGPRSCSSDNDCTEIIVENDWGADEKFPGNCACDKNTTCSYTGKIWDKPRTELSNSIILLSLVFFKLLW